MYAACHVVPIFVPYMTYVYCIPPMFLLLLKMSTEVTNFFQKIKKFAKKKKKNPKSQNFQKNDWYLVIKSPNHNDSGIYEC
jgi:hypothetical protein